METSPQGQPPARLNDSDRRRSAAANTPKPHRLRRFQRPLAADMGTWDKVKKLLGFGPECLNGGIKDNSGNCECQSWFEGKQCEEIICTNDGRVNEARTACHCPDSKRHHGTHCELTVCDNSGKDRGDGTCQCVDDWYTGDFCQHYSSPWGVLFGAAGAVLLLLVLVCVLCRLRPCSRPSRRRRRRRPEELPTDLPRRSPDAAAQPPPYDAPKLNLPPPSYYEVVRDLDKFPRSNPLASPPPPTAASSSATTPFLPPTAENSVNELRESGRPPRVQANPMGHFGDERETYDQTP